jgi:hypothetical protein
MLYIWFVLVVLAFVHCIKGFGALVMTTIRLLRPVNYNSYEVRNEFSERIFNRLGRIHNEGSVQPHNIDTHFRLKLIKLVYSSDEIYAEYTFKEASASLVKSKFRNLIWIFLKEDCFVVHILGQCTEKINFDYGITLDHCANQILKHLTDAAPPTSWEDDMSKHLNDIGDSEEQQILDKLKTTNLVENTELTNILTHLSCRLDAILSKL